MGMKFRSTEDRTKALLYRCDVKARSANTRFKDSISKWDVYDSLVRLEFKCFYCAELIKPNKWQLDHFNPRANGGLNDLDNLVCTCKWCNTMKNALDGRAFITKCTNIIHNNYFALNDIDLDIIEREKAIKGRKLHKKAIKYFESNIDIKKLDDKIIEVVNECLIIATDRQGDSLVKIKKP